MKTLLLFDWTTGGHHARYVRRFAEALGPSFHLVMAIPEVYAGEVSDLPVEVHSLGAPRPRVDMTRPLAGQNRELAVAEVSLLRKAVAKVGPDHLVHLYSDPIIRRLVQQPDLGVPTTLFIFYPRAHYVSLFGASLSPKERLRAWFLEYLVARWRRRPDAHSLLTLDAEAASRWDRQGGVPVHWLPEPPVANLPTTRRSATRRGCVLYGALAARKGIDILAAALTTAPVEVDVVLAGAVDPEYRPALDRHVAAMRRMGARVEVRPGLHTELEGLQVLADARCAVVPYVRTYGMSRSLLEAASVGTPLIAHQHVLVGHLVRKHDLGLAVDCSDPRALREAILRLSSDPDAGQRYEGALARFCAAYSWPRFRAALLGCLDGADSGRLAS
jgi:glycosyltransferase involved in cell wall biosynthesis